MANIFTPLQIKNRTVKNRIVMGAAERVGFSYHDGLMGEDLVRDYETVAQNNVGMMISQSLVISPEDVVACGFPVPGMYKPEHVDPLRRMVRTAHENDVVFIAQLGIAIPYSPSWTTKDIEDLLTRYLYSARLCVEAGVDGIEIHGAHNVTLNHILSQRTNGRQDRYADGLNLVREMVNGIRAFAPEDLILSFRMGCCFDWDTDIRTAKAIEEMGFDLLNVSVGVQEGYAPGIPANYEYTPMTYAASLLKKHVSIPVIAAWGIETLNRGEKLMSNGDADLVAYARSFLADPQFVTRSESDLNYKPCMGCRSCQWYSNGSRCPGRKKANKQHTL